MTDRSDGPILVTGATGAQGGGAVKALLAQGFAVRALVRDPETRSAKDLSAKGVELARGDFDDAGSLDEALRGVRGVFSMQMPPRSDDPDSEIRAGTALVDAAHRAGVETFVHTSVARAGEHEAFVGWDEGRWWSVYWTSKSAVNDAVKARGFPNHVILKPAFMMENFAMPKVAGMFPALLAGRVETAIAPDVRLDLIAADDIGAFAAAAFANPARFDGHEIDLAGDSLTMTEVAAALSAETGREIVARSMSEQDLVATGVSSGVASSHAWMSVEGYRVDIEAARSWGVPLASFPAWLAGHRRQLGHG